MEEQMITTPDVPVEVVDIQFRPGQKVYFFDPAGHSLQAGDHVIMDTARGPEFGTVTAANHYIPQRDVVAPLRSVLRIATAQDEKVAQENQAKEKRVFEVCLQKIAEHGLDMQLVSAECAFDGSKILFFFTADERVDFRELVKNLASIFHTRIELRQIGVRDKAKMVGGLGICGRPFCCASFLDDFQPVSIKMAKTQNLSLNPTKISGTCGRLMCCLKYEQEAYEDLLRTSPKEESFVDTPDGRGTVVEVDLLRQRVKVKMEEHPEIITFFPNSEIAVLRNGKAKKNDPPIPDDLAPISGSGKQTPKDPPDEEAAVLLDSIRFRYSTETIADDAAQEDAPSPDAEQEVPKRPNRRRIRQSKPKTEQQPESQPAEANAQQEKTQPSIQKSRQEKSAPEKKPAATEGESAPEKKHHYRPSHRRRKPKPKGGNQGDSQG